MVPFRCCWNYAAIGHIGRPHRYANFQFCSFICDYCSSQRSHPRISKTYLFIVSLNVDELELMQAPPHPSLLPSSAWEGGGGAGSPDLPEKP